LGSTFYGLEIAKTGLFASQRAIDLTGHNIANANTVGYTRQRLVLTSQEIVSGGERFLNVTKGYSGGGVKILGVEQIRNQFLDRQYRREFGMQEMWGARSDAMGYIEDVFNETGDSGLSSTINDFFTSMHTLTMNPESKEYRTNVKQNAIKMTDAFKHIASQLSDKQMEQNEAVRVTAIQINDTATGIADLNDQIFRFELKSDKANDLRDKRNNLLDTLSGLTDITYSEDAEGQVAVQIGGKTLVDKNTSFLIDANPTKTNPIAGGSNLIELTWHDYLEPDGVTPSPVVATSGKLKSYVDMRDGNSSDNMGIPYLMGRLDTLASTIATEINKIHRGGWTLPDISNGNVSATNVNFFAEPAGGITAANFNIDAAIISSVFNIAAAGSQILTTAERGDYQNALNLSNLQENVNISGVGSIDGYLKGFVAEIGVETAHTNQMYEGEQSLVDSLSNQKQSVSGVSVDEEMTNLIKFQQSYSASARVITAIDEYLDVLINKMGIVGR
jgi:flagellar hook-associated protein 1